VLVFVLVCAAAVIAFMGIRGQGNSAPLADNPISTLSAQPSTPAQSNSSAPPMSPEEQQAAAHATAFLEAYYLLLPDDTEDSRLQRLYDSHLLPTDRQQRAELLKQLDVTMKNPDLPAEIARRQTDKFTMKAAILPKTWDIGEYDHDSPDLVQVYVDITHDRVQDGNVDTGVAMRTRSVWQKHPQSDRLTILQFEGGDSG
jgi:hypothetical protein